MFIRPPKPLTQEEIDSWAEQMFGPPKKVMTESELRDSYMEQLFGPSSTYERKVEPSNETKSEELTETKQKKARKTPIPRAVKNAVWIKYVGEEVGNTKCFVCNLKTISQMTFHCGHVIAEANGGQIHIDNLRPICSTCNQSMGTMNMDEFRNKHF